MTPEELTRATPERPIRVGRYDVLGVLGAGGMGTVFDAVDREHGTPVALKTLHRVSAGGLLRLKNEFRAVADVRHSNLVQLYELACVDELWFFTMERIFGGDFLGRFRDPSGPRPLPSTVREDAADPRGEPAPLRATSASPPRSLPDLRAAFGQLVDGVRALHRAGLLHLDIKPSNVLVDRAGRVVLVDFGLVRPVDAPPAPPLDASAIIAGTPGWMAPEQVVGQAIAEPADWYAVGLLLYVALTGAPAFPSGGGATTWYAQRNVQPPAPHRLLDGVPLDLSELAVALLRPDPAGRPRGDEVARVVSAAGGDAAPIRRVGAELVGRERERDLFRAALHHVGERRAALVHVVGPSGIGKTALLSASLDEAHRGADALVLRGRCYERESVPFKAFDGILDELAVRLAAREPTEVVRLLPRWIVELRRVFPVLANVPVIDTTAPEGGAPGVSALELRRRAASALRDLVVALAEERPVVLAIDDLQWADADSIALLVALLAPAPPAGLLVAVSLRAADAVQCPLLAPYLDAVRALPEGVPLVSIDLGPLGERDAEELAAATLAAHGVAVEGLETRIANEAAGVPFFLAELARYAAQRKRVGASLRDEDVVLERVLAARVQSLGEAERSLVEVLAVADGPVPLSPSFAVAGIEPGSVLRALWTLSADGFVRSTGAAADDRLELDHDRMREAVLAAMPPARVDDLRLALGRALASSGEEGPWLFAAVRCLNAVAHLLDAGERLATARLDLAAAARARHAAAFRLAFDFFHAGTTLLDESSWDDQYDLALALHAGAAEAAYLSASFGELDAHVARVQAKARTIVDQLLAREVEIDAAIARRRYAEAVDVALDALRRLDVELPAHPGEAEVGAELARAMTAVAPIGPEGLASLPNAVDPRIVAAIRIQARITSAAYFSRPMLLPVIACRLVATSVEHGLSPATPYALSVFGIVLNSMGRLREAHAWGRAALALLDVFDDKSLEARTRHVVHDLVCTWTVPLASTLGDLRRVVDVGKANGDLEYAGYAAHAFVHNSFYASRELEGLLRDALELGAFLRACDEVNALHVHRPFEQILRAFTGRTVDPARLDGDGFDETVALETAERVGSRSAQCILRLLMGIVRFHFGRVDEASALFEAARPYLDGVASTWHVPVLHQYAALAIHDLPPSARATLASAAEASLASLAALAAHGPENFAHKVELVRAARARADGDLAGALDACRRAIAGAEAGEFWNDVALAHDLAARCHAAREEVSEAEAHRRAGEEAWGRWGVRRTRLE